MSINRLEINVILGKEAQIRGRQGGTNQGQAKVVHTVTLPAKITVVAAPETFLLHETVSVAK